MKVVKKIHEPQTQNPENKHENDYKIIPAETNNIFPNLHNT